MAILEAHNPSAQNVATKMSLPFAWRGSGARPQELLKKAADRGEIKLLRRPEGLSSFRIHHLRLILCYNKQGAMLSLR